jgi:glycosyltransferase involved in cell wall biosynthesis
MNSAGISIVVPTLGNLMNLQNLYLSISQQEIDLNQVDLILVVNGIFFKEYELLKTQLISEFSLPVTFLYSEVANVNKARNRGLEVAKYNVVYFLDDDCQLINSSTLTFHLSEHARDANLFALGGGYSLSIEASYWDELYNSIQMSWLLSGKQGASAETQHLLGGNFSLKKEYLKLKELKFDERISYGGSEYQLFIQAVQKNLCIQLCNIDVRHNTNESFLKICSKIFRQGRGKAIIEEKSNLHSEKIYSAKLSFMSTVADFKISIVKDSLLKKIFNYIFWYGYYKENKTPLLLGLKILKDFINYLNYLRFRIIDKFK